MIEFLALFGDAVERGKILRAIILTHSGRPTETPLGILTIADLPVIVNSAAARLPLH